MAATSLPKLVPWEGSGVGKGMICPSCGWHDCARSERRGFRDRLATWIVLRPWRCMKCKRRFYARKVAWELTGHAHCPRCGNLELESVSRERAGKGKLAQVFYLMGFSAYRCDGCRVSFYSLRPPYRPRTRRGQTVVDWHRLNVP